MNILVIIGSAILSGLIIWFVFIFGYDIYIRVKNSGKPKCKHGFFLIEKCCPICPPHNHEYILNWSDGDFWAECECGDVVSLDSNADRDSAYEQMSRGNKVWKV